MSTTIQRFGRTMRNEPHCNVYKHRVWVKQDKVTFADVEAWLANRYLDKKRKASMLWRIYGYKHVDGNKYVDFIALASMSDADVIYIKMRWGISETKINRGDRVPMRRMSKEQAAILRSQQQRVKEDFQISLGWREPGAYSDLAKKAMG